MGRRKIEIKPIKDERNRSVTFLKRKGGLFKKAYELSELCSVDVAVIIFSHNNKLHQFSSREMRDLVYRWNCHGTPNESKGPSDFNGGADEEEEDDEQGTPPQGEPLDSHMLPRHHPAQHQYHLIRNQTASASPPIPNGAFGPHPGNGHAPQSQTGSRPSSRNDIRRIGPNMVGQPAGPPVSQPGAMNGFGFVPQATMYNMPTATGMPTHSLPQQQHAPFPYPQSQSHPMYVDEQRRSSGPPAFPHQPQGAAEPRHSVSPPKPPAAQLPSQLPPQANPHMSPPPPQPQAHPVQSPPQPQQLLPPPPPPPQQQEPVHLVPQIVHPPHNPQPPAPMEPKPEAAERPRQPPLLNTNIKKQPPRQGGGSIFTPVEVNPSVLGQHLAAFGPAIKSEPPTSRPQSTEARGASRGSNPNSPPSIQRAQVQPQIKRTGSLGSIPDTTFTPPSRSNSLLVGGNPSRPRLKVQIPDESDGGSATNESSSPRGTTATDATSQISRRLTDSHSSGRTLPPPSPSGPTLLSAGAGSGPPNPFARPPPQQSNNMHIDTPVSALLPSRALHGDLLPSPNGFYSDWGFRGSDSNTTLSPMNLNFATPIGPTGPSFLNDLGPPKRKSPEISSDGGQHESVDAGNESKRVKVDS
ncbi:hypothetical protein VTI74DRAFT_1291 [Chaetomium olivicolor]